MRSVLFAARSAVALNRLLDVLPVFAGDDRIERLFTLMPGSDFHVEALAAVEHVGAKTLPWEHALHRPFDLVLAANPKGMLGLLRGTRVLLPHGAGFSKRVPGEGSAGSGLDPANLVQDGRSVASFHALAHPSHVERLASLAPEAAAHAAVIGDPTLERILASRALRDRYRETLGTGARRLIVLISTWGPESLLRRRPTLPAELAARLPHDAFQIALIVHPNARSQIGSFDLAERLAPALDAGMILPAPYEEWAAVLIASDAVITDHGSTALYAAALDLPVIGAYDGGVELISGSPMEELLTRSPHLDGPGDLVAAIDGNMRGSGPLLAESVFAEQGHGLERLRDALYSLLGLTPPPGPATARLLRDPSAPTRAPAAFAVRAWIDGDQVRVERRPAHSDPPADHLAAEYGAAGERHIQSAGLIYRRADRRSPSVYDLTWTVDAWTAHILDDHPGCRLAAVIVTPSLAVARARGGALVSARLRACTGDGRIVRTDPSAVLSAIYAWLAAHPDLPADIACVIADQTFQVRLSRATAFEAARPV
ncbi:MAG TPA: hypothetical protein VGL93_23365 [Streptosporangiaceae bacterium]|jgi:hypothetical protein